MNDKPQTHLTNCKKAFALTALLLSFFCCKKNGKVSTQPGASNSVVVYTNSSDPRLAQIQTTSGKRYTFFGQRDGTGAPIRVTGYSLSTLPDSTDADFVTFDDSGRYSSFYLHTGISMHLSYNIPDSVEIVLSQPDSVPKRYIAATGGSSTIKHSPATPLSFARPKVVAGGAGTGAPASDGNVDVSVTDLNTYTQFSSVDSTATVIVNIFNGNQFNFSLPATYNPQTTFYSVPLTNFSSSFAYTSNTSTAVTTTVNLIKTALTLVCLSSPDTDPSLSIQVGSLLEDVEEDACLVGPLPCAAFAALVITCSSSEIIDVLENVLDDAGNFVTSIDPNTAPYSAGATVSVTTSGAYGTMQSAQSLSVGQVLTNFTGYDFQQTFTYSDSTTGLGDFAGTNTFVVNANQVDSVFFYFTSGANNVTGVFGWYAPPISSDIQLHGPVTGVYSPGTLTSSPHLLYVDSLGNSQEYWGTYIGTLIGNEWSGNFTLKQVLHYVGVSPDQTGNYSGTFDMRR